MAGHPPAGGAAAGRFALTRDRTREVRQRGDECNRIQKLLEDRNIELAGVAGNVPGASGRDMLRALGDGLDVPEALADRARGRLRDSPPPRAPALPPAFFRKAGVALCAPAAGQQFQG